MSSRIVSAALVVATLAASAPVSAAALRYLGGYASLGSTLGEAGLAIGDVDGDGRADILVTGATNTFGGGGLLTLLEADASAADGYRELGFSGVFEDGLSAATLVDLRGEGRCEIVAGTPAGEVFVYAGASLDLVGSASVADAVTDFKLADADDDGHPDLVVASAAAITLFDPVSLIETGSVPYGAREIAIGDVDGDGKNEVVLNTGQVLRLSRIGGDLEADVVWTYPSGDFGIHVALADIDDDGMPELIAESDWDYLTAWDLDIHSPKWQLRDLGDLDALTLADVNGDGRVEAIIGSGQWGDETAIDLATHAVLWSVPNPDHGTAHIAVGDIDDDGQADLLWSAGYTDTGEDVLYAYSLPGLVEKFHTLDVSGPFDAVALSAPQAGAGVRVAFASNDSLSGYADGIVWQWDAQTLQPLTRTDVGSFGRFAWTGIHALAYGNIHDADGGLDLLVGTDRLYDGAIYVVDAATSDVEEQRIVDVGAPIESLAFADLDGDGHAEIVAGDVGAHTGSPGEFVYVFDASTGAERWRSINLTQQFGSIPSVAVGDVDGDRYLDIVAVARAPYPDGGHLYQFTGPSHVQWESSEGEYTTATTFDADSLGDGREEIVAGKLDGTIVVLDGVTHAVLATYSIGSGEVDALAAVRGPCGAWGCVAAVVDGMLKFRDLHTGETIGTTDAEVGETRGLAVLGEPIARVFVGGTSAFRVFELDGEPIFANGFD